MAATAPAFVNNLNLRINLRMLWRPLIKYSEDFLLAITLVSQVVGRQQRKKSVLHIIASFIVALLHEFMNEEKSLGLKKTG